MKQTSNFEVSGKLLNVGPLETRTSRAGKDYQIREIELDLTDSEYSNYVVLQMIGKSATYAEGFKPGDYVTVSCSLKGSQGQDGRRWANVNAFYIAAQVLKGFPASVVFPAHEPKDDDFPF